MTDPAATGDSQPPPFRGERELIVLSKAPAPGGAVRARRGAVAAPATVDLDPLTAILDEYGAHMTPVFEATARAPVAGIRSAARRAAVPTVVAELPSFFSVQVADNRKEELAARLRQHPLIEAAFVKPSAEPPVRPPAKGGPASPPLPAVPAPPAATGNLAPRQGYLQKAPGGVDARSAWKRPGGRGAGINVIDVEGEWNFSHEDLLVNQGGMIGGSGANDLGWRNHGTAVVGEIGADVNNLGCTGIASDSRVRAVSIFGVTGGSAGAIRQAADALSPGDILLIELHFPGPRRNFSSRNDQLGYIAAEWWPDNLAAIVYATAVRRVIVVEAAGNGAENFDDPLYDVRPPGFPASWRNPFRMTNPQSGAIVVGAGAPPLNTHGNNIWGPDRSRLDFSNYGARLDAQGWGREVTTTGYGDFAGSTENQWYTDVFSGTSSASPIIVGVLACLQGALRAAGKPLLTPATAQALLRATGSAQQAGLNGPATQRIGSRPDLKAALRSLGLTGPKPKKPKKPKKPRKKSPQPSPGRSKRTGNRRPGTA
jgi:hypothetical protein